MQIEWIKDFLTLADAHAFSRAAERRNVSQPTFSRHIQALEDWLGVELIDRRTQGVRLTSAGQIFRGFAADLLRRTYDMRNVLRGQSPEIAEAVRFAVAQTLSLTYFPYWLSALKRSLGNLVARVSAVNVSEGADALTEGGVDLLLNYHHPQLPALLASDRFQYLTLATDRMLPCSVPNRDGRPRHRLPGTAGQPIALLAYSSGTYFAHTIEMILLNASERCHFERSFDTHMSEALKAMVVEGHGLGWLPESCVVKELAEKRLVVAGGGQWSCVLEVRLYRSLESVNPMVDRIWQFFRESENGREKTPVSVRHLSESERFGRKRE
ncbi:MAG: LysR family transcriptional regulator [Candidatus Accumulibacter sp.]|jgi:DNA-binding transcriptional LysR family regulator|nr:LysR family transcriptional regulator [Accumulibacter sp.]